MKNKSSDLDKLLHHLYTPDRLESIQDIRDELSTNGIDSARVLGRVMSLLKEPAKSAPKKPAWLDSARATRARIEGKFNEQRAELRRKYGSPQDLVAAIRSGAFGSVHQQKANAFFRNQDFKSLSDQDLLSFIEDCELLGALSKKDDSE